MAKVRYVIMVPTVVEEDIVEAFAAEHGRYVAGGYAPVKAEHPRKADSNYTAFVVEACVVTSDDPPVFEPMFNIEEYVAPGAA